MTTISSSPDVPPFYGYVETTVNALRLIHAARQGVIPRITRRLNDTERRTMIKSGAVFVFSVEESGIKRWTDGLLWSPSRIVSNFLVYREINERASSRGAHKKSYTSEETSSRSLPIHRNSAGQLSSGYKGNIPGGHVNDQGTFKPGGLIKKTITVTIEGSDLHLISYYTSEDIRSGRLKRPSTRSDIMSLHMPPHIFRLTNFRVPPKVEIGPDGKPRLVSEPEDHEHVECKVEEQTYMSPGSPGSPISQSSSPDNPFPGSALYPVSPGGYSRSGVDRWTASVEGLRISSSPVRQDASVPLSPSTTHASYSSLGSRRETGALNHPDTWSSSTQSGRWQGDAYDSTTPTTALYADRPRLRSSNPYPTSSSMVTRENEATPSIIGRYSSHVHRSREVGSQRLPWLMAQESSSDEKESRGPHSRSSYTSSTPLQFTADGYHSYGSSWSSNESGSLEINSSQTPFSPHTYNSSYASESGKLSNSEYPGSEYTNS